MVKDVLKATALRALTHPAARQATGLHLIGDLHGCMCGQELLRDPLFLEQLCTQKVEAAGLTAVGSVFHAFGTDGGVTGVVVLAESHLSVHTWPESAYVTLDVYVCNYTENNRPKAQKLFNELQAAFKPSEARLHRMDRA